LSSAPSSPTRLLAYRWFWLVAFLLFAADRLTKGAVIARFPFNSYGLNGYEVFPGFFHIVHVGNTGAAWSMFSGMSTMLALIAIVTLGAIFYWRHALGLPATVPQLCIGLLSGGTLGNLYDRLRYGHVVDFLDFHFGSYTFPTFNVADSGIFVGVVTYILWSLRQPTSATAGES
jgi:signal peptidase II